MLRAAAPYTLHGTNRPARFCAVRHRLAHSLAVLYCATALTTYYYGGGGGKERGQSFCRYIVPLGTRGFGFWRASLSSLLTRWHACARAGPASVAASRRDWPRGTSFILTPPFSFTRSLVAVPVKEEKRKKERLLIGW
ncbi:hypothetical protein BHM03_00006011 [Ensete ventricosum]|nr:hypothetical protein BHM03_00006011 [Ensete ventricosum]